MSTTGFASAPEQPGLANAGEPFAVGERSATMLDDPAAAYYVAAGVLDLFTVTIDDGRAIEGRSHFASMAAGGVVFGLDPRQQHGTLLLATAAKGTTVRRISAIELDTLARQPDGDATIAALVDRWLTAASTHLTSDLSPRPEVAVALEAGVQASLSPGQRARAAERVVWIPIERRGLRFIGMRTLAPAQPPLYAPLTTDTWLEPDGPDPGAVVIEPRDTRALLASGQLWTSLRSFNDLIGVCVATAERQSVRHESERLDHKAREAEAARDVAFDVLSDVFLDREREVAAPAAATGPLAPILEACRLAGATLGIEVRAPADVPSEPTFQDHVAAIAAASGFRTRVVALRADWWRTDAGALVGHTEGGAAVALLPRGPRAYVSVDVTAGTEHAVTPAYAATLAPFAVALYRPLPPGPLRPLDLMRFGARGLAPDLWMVLGTGLLVSALGAAVPLLTGEMIDRAIPQGERALLVQLGLGMLLLALANTALSVVKSVAVVRMESRIDSALQSAVWIRLLALPAGFFRRYGAGDLADRASGIDAIRQVLSTSGIGSLLGLVNAIAYLGLMLYLSPALTAVAVAITLGLVAFSTLGNFLLLRTQRQEVDLRGQIASLMLQLIAGVAKVRISGAENHAFRVWAQRFADQKRLSFSLGRLENALMTLGSGFQVLAPLAIFAAIYRLQSGDGAAPALTTGEFVAFYAAFGIFSTAMGDVCSVSLSLLVIVPYYERLQPILSAAPENDSAKPHPGRLKGEVAVSRVHFRYRADGPWVLKDVSFSIRPGEFVALVGPSGCGKSTLLRLLLGFEQPSSGAVQYDGVDISQLDARALRQQIGVVLQESRLMPTDIYRNIVGDSSRTLNEAWAAAEQAGLADDIRRMPMGLHTIVSEGGGTFSGGQSQRLLIARALVAKPRIIFFDEATSALDNRAQAVVTESLDRLEATRVVIAHRLSTLVGADRIVYLDGGQIQEQGTYQELMAKGGPFAQLAGRQMV
nr:vitamin B12 import ATP-binding protein BtuD [uncultured bacterium]